MACINACFIGGEVLEKLPEPALVGQTRVGGIDFNKLRMCRTAEAILALSASPQGFTASDLASQVHAMTGQPESEYGPRQAAYDIKKLRAKDMAGKIGKSRRYEVLPQGLRSLTALLVIREKIIRPLLTASGQPPAAKRGHCPAHKLRGRKREGRRGW